jgi:hypothetical protein
LWYVFSGVGFFWGVGFWVLGLWYWVFGIGCFADYFFVSIMNTMNKKNAKKITKNSTEFRLAKLTVKPIQAILFGGKIRLSSLL